MDNDGAGDQRQKELAISFAASSMINASDTINQEAYQANVKRIQEVKEMVRRLEMNNETAHKNFLVDQLEKRAKDGREAEIMLTRLRNQPGLREVQFTNNTPSHKSDVILPTTATLVEVPESRSSSVMYSSPTPVVASPPQATQHGRPAEHQWNNPPWVHQAQSYDPNIFRYYTPPSTARPQHSAAPHSTSPINGQIGRYTTQNVSPQFRVNNSLPHKSGLQPSHVQQPAQSWGGYPQPVTSLPAAETVPAPVNYSIPPGWTRTPPAQSTGSSSTGFPMQTAASGPPVTIHSPPQNLPSHVPASHVQVPLHGVVASSAKVASGQPPIQSHPKPAESQSQPIFTTISKPRRSYKSSQQPQQQPQQLRPQPQQLPQPLQPQPCPQEFPPQRPLQPLQMHLQAASKPVDRVPFTSVSQSHSQPSQIRESLPAGVPTGVSQAHPPQSIMVQEQAKQREAQSNADLATFIKLFQIAVQRGILQLKAFSHQAKASGISDEWFRAAISSLPRDVWESVVAQVNQSGPTPGFLSPWDVPQQGTSANPGPNVPVVRTRPSTPATALVQTTLATQLPAKPSASGEESFALSVPRQTSGSYAAQMQYYAEQATKSTLSAQVASLSSSTITPPNIPSIQKMVATPTGDVPYTQVNVRTPKHANKSTLARDVLRSLGKIVPKRHQETGGEPIDEDNDRGGDQLLAVKPPQPVSHTAAPKSPVVVPTTRFIRVNTPSISSAEPDAQVGPNLSTAKQEVEKTAAINGPIMIDLTLDDSDESVHGKRQKLEPNFPIQTSAGAATSSQPVSPASITNHTLLENLSLEERSVNVSADGDNADVRMHSPPLSTPAEENMESELLYPPLGGAELVLSSFEPLPREASDHPLDGPLPLFLPSPPVSPAHTEPPETDLEMTNDEDERRSSFKRRSADVDEKENNAELLTPRVRKRRRQQVYVLVPPAPPYVRKAIKKMKERAMGKETDLDSEGAGEDEEFQYSHLEQLLIEESKSRLLERRCRWSNCGVILNCAANLLVHLKNHIREEDSEGPFLCRWARCQKQFGMGQERDVHLERHTIRPLPCPFAGCDEQFDKPVEVMQHEVQHTRTERTGLLIPKRTCQPVVPAIPAHLGQPPHWLPSHRVIARRVVRCRISADRHATMGPWILWNIFSPVELNTRKQNASMRGRLTRQAIDYDKESSDGRRDDYDFLLALSSYPAKSAELDDLDSTLITMSAARGLTLWGSERNREEPRVVDEEGRREESAVDGML